MWRCVQRKKSLRPSQEYDGSKQWAYKGKPLYTFAKDTKPGDVTGDGFLNGAWHLAMP